ncbi:MAG: hypothetical protein MdMp014T_0472 [Treponematales bacterium]
MTALYKGTAKETAAQFAALVSKDLAEARFLDGQNRGRIGRYEALLKEVKDAAAKAGRPLADSDINAALAAAIGAAVDGEFGKISFLLEGSPNGSYNVVLTRNSKNGQLVLSYEGYFNGTKSTKELSGSSVEDLASKMSASGHFNKTTVAAVRAQAALIPAVHIQASELTAIKQMITDFYRAPSQNKFYDLVEKYRRYTYTSSAKDAAIAEALHQTIKSLNLELGDRLISR